VVGEVHDTYLQWLAELGLPLTVLLLAFGWAALRGGLRAFQDGRHRPEAGVLLAGLAGLAVFGLFQHIFYVSAVALLSLGLLAGLILLDPAPPQPSPARRRVLTLLAVILALGLGAVKAGAIAAAPFRVHLQVGFSYGEWQPDGRQAWWTVGPKALLGYWAGHRYLVLPVAVNHPYGPLRPVKVRAWVAEDCQAETTLIDKSWRELKLDLGETYRGRPIRVVLTADQTFWPARLGDTGDRRWLGVLAKDPYPADK
jgi:O-antigen ligase